MTVTWLVGVAIWVEVDAPAAEILEGRGIRRARRL
jgi:hypothetical protein